MFILISCWELFGSIFRLSLGVHCWVPFWMPLFRLLIQNGSPKSPAPKGRGGFWAPQGPKGDPKPPKIEKSPATIFE